MEDIERRRHNEAVLKVLKPGDLIRFYEDYGEHWAIYVGEEKGNTSIIHYWKENAVASSPRITITSFWKCAGQMIAEKKNKENSDRIHAMNLVKRAKDFMQKLEEEEKTGEHKTYPDLFYSCEQFAKWCYYGLGGLDTKWCLSDADWVIDINRVKNVRDFVHGIFTNHTSDGQAIWRNVDVLGQLQPGDVIRFSRGLYEHWATYIGQDKDKTIPKSVIHWWDNDGASNFYIKIVPFWELAGNCKVEKFNSDRPDNIALTESEAVECAKYKMEWITNKITPLWHTVKDKTFHCSEDFAKWFYLNLMCKPRPAEPSNTDQKSEFNMDEVLWLCCKHEGADFTFLRAQLNAGVVVELEREQSKQLFETLQLEIGRHKKDPKLEGQTRIRVFPPETHFETVQPEIGRHKTDPKLEDQTRIKVLSPVIYFETGQLEKGRHKKDPNLEDQTRIRVFPPVIHFDPCFIFARRKNDEVLKKLNPGDFIKFVEKSCNHWGLYIGGGTFFHWTAECHVTYPCRTSGGCTTCIEIGSENTLKEAEKLEKLNCEGGITDGAQVIKRVQAIVAKIKAGEKSGENYRALFNDCEHFATWCHYGLGNKRLKISTEDIEQTKDVHKFVQGEFSPIPWQIYPKKRIPVYQKSQLSKSISDVGEKSYMDKAGSAFLPNLQQCPLVKPLFPKV